jgi:hypothetical protein
VRSGTGATSGRRGRRPGMAPHILRALARSRWPARLGRVSESERGALLFISAPDGAEARRKRAAGDARARWSVRTAHRAPPSTLRSGTGHRAKAQGRAALSLHRTVSSLTIRCRMSPRAWRVFHSSKQSFNEGRNRCVVRAIQRARTAPAPLLSRLHHHQKHRYKRRERRHRAPDLPGPRKLQVGALVPLRRETRSHIREQFLLKRRNAE